MVFTFSIYLFLRASVFNIEEKLFYKESNEYEAK